jgi:hypothetical protein
MKNVIVASGSFVLFSETYFASLQQYEKNDICKIDSAPYSCTLYFAVNSLKTVDADVIFFF